MPRADMIQITAELQMIEPHLVIGVKWDRNELKIHIKRMTPHSTNQVNMN